MGDNSALSKFNPFTGPRSAVVSASDCGSEGLGFESHQSHVGFFGPGTAPTQSWECYGPSGKAANHTAELHPLNGCVFEGVALIHLTNTARCRSSRVWLTPRINCDSKRGLRPCQVVSTEMDLHSSHQLASSSSSITAKFKKDNNLSFL